MDYKDILNDSGGVGFGWTPPSLRTPREVVADAAAKLAMPRFPRAYLSAAAAADDRKLVMLTDYWKHPAVVKALGYPYPGVHQLTGSCVGAGGGNAAATRHFIEVCKYGEAEKIVVPFWLLPYGRSRLYGGWSTPGEGSMGSTFAEAAVKDGFLDSKMSGLPSFANSDQLVWGASAERSWSDGDAQQTLTLLPQSRLHVFQATTPCKSADDCRLALLADTPITIAWNDYADPSTAKTQNGKVTIRFSNRGGHQTTLLGWCEDPDGSEWFYYCNQWGYIYPQDPLTGLKIGGWLPKSQVDMVCKNRDGEVFAFFGWQGLPPDTFSWGLGDET
jgi:hypothetical protein